MKIFLKRLLTIISTVAAVFAIIGLVLMFLGYRPFIIESNSMEPLFQKGSLTFINTRTSLGEIKVGDVLAYRADADPLVLHRLISIENKGNDELVVQMQGDMNSTVQEVMLSRVNIVGKEAFTIPRLGTLVSSASGVFPVLVVLLIILACLPRLPRLSRLLHKKETKAGDPA